MRLQEVLNKFTNADFLLTVNGWCEELDFCDYEDEKERNYWKDFKNKRVTDLALLTTNGRPELCITMELDYLLMTAMNREYILKRILDRYKEKYDYVIIDCLPSLNLLAVNALAAADEVIVPVQAQYLSAKGLDLLLQTVLKVQANLNPSLKIAGIVITMLDGRAVFQKELVQEITEAYGTAIHFFESTIPLSVKVSEAQAKSNTSIDMKRTKVAQSYLRLAEEVMSNG